MKGIPKMLSEKILNSDSNYYYMEFRNVPKELIPWLEDLTLEYKCKVEKKEWKSKYNHYVIYDYEPFCSEGFDISLTISSKSAPFLNFVRYLYEYKVQTITHLNNWIMI
jgi:hypothetical protein